MAGIAGALLKASKQNPQSGPARPKTKKKAPKGPNWLPPHGEASAVITWQGRTRLHGLLSNVHSLHDSYA